MHYHRKSALRAWIRLHRDSFAVNAFRLFRSIQQCGSCRIHLGARFANGLSNLLHKYLSEFLRPLKEQSTRFFQNLKAPMGRDFFTFEGSLSCGNRFLDLDFSGFLNLCNGLAREFVQYGQFDVRTANDPLTANKHFWLVHCDSY